MNRIRVIEGKPPKGTTNAGGLVTMRHLFVADLVKRGVDTVYIWERDGQTWAAWMECLQCQ